MVLRAQFLILAIVLTAGPSLASVDTAWVRRTSNKILHVESGENGSVYFAGAGDGILAMKYDSLDETVWVTDYTGPPGPLGDDWYQRAEDLAVDDSGRACVVGSIYSWDTGDFDVTTLRYDIDGTLLWARRFSDQDGVRDYAGAIAIDHHGHVIVAGGIDSSATGGDADYDIVILKYDAEGTLLWEWRYNGPGSGNDYPETMMIDANANIYVAGSSTGIGTWLDYVVLKLDPSGSLIWEARYEGPVGNDYGRDLALGHDTSVYVTVQSRETDGRANFATVKLSPTGEQVWVRRFAPPAVGSAGAEAICISRSGCVHVTGDSQQPDETGHDYRTMTYDPFGNLEWNHRYDGPADFTDFAKAILTDTLKNVYVGGESEGLGNDRDLCILKYSPTGSLIWEYRYDPGSGDSDEYFSDMGMDSAGNLYVLGQDYGVSGFESIILKLAQCECLCIGDPECDSASDVLDVVEAIDVAFRNNPSSSDIHCPIARTDADCDNDTDVLDVVRFVNVAFRNADPVAEFCDPCP